MAEKSTASMCTVETSSLADPTGSMIGCSPASGQPLCLLCLSRQDCSLASVLTSKVHLCNWQHFKHSPFLLQAKAEGEKDAWEGFRASLRLLHPALVLPLPPDLLGLNPDISSLPPPPPPPVEGDGSVSEEDPGTDSPMMWLSEMHWYCYL